MVSEEDIEVETSWEEVTIYLNNGETECPEKCCKTRKPKHMTNLYKDAETFFFGCMI